MSRAPVRVRANPGRACGVTARSRSATCSSDSASRNVCRLWWGSARPRNKPSACTRRARAWSAATSCTTTQRAPGPGWGSGTRRWRSSARAWGRPRGLNDDRVRGWWVIVIGVISVLITIDTAYIPTRRFKSYSSRPRTPFAARGSVVARGRRS